MIPATQHLFGQALKQTLTDAFKKAMKSDTVQQWAEKNYYDLSGLAGEEAKKQFAKLESNFAWTLKDLGATEVDPAELDIPKP